MLAARCKRISLASLSLEKASDIIVPMSSVTANNTSPPPLWAVIPGIASISFSFRHVECISWVSSARPSLISLLQYSFLKSESLKTVVCGCPYLEFCILAMRSARTILWAADWLFHSDELSLSCSRACLYCAARHLAWYFAPIATMSAVLSFDMRRNSLNLWATDQTPESISIVHAILTSPSLADSSQKKHTGRFMLSGNILELSVCCCFGRGSLQAFSFFIMGSSFVLTNASRHDLCHKAKWLVKVEAIPFPSFRHSQLTAKCNSPTS